MRVQVKIMYGSNNYDRCKTTVVSRDELICMSLEELSTMVSKVVGGYFQAESRLRIQYRDDEGTYVTMNDETDVSDAVRSSVQVPQEDELVRVCLRVDNDFTPTNRSHASPPKKRTCDVESKRKLGFPVKKYVPHPYPDLYELLQSNDCMPSEMPIPKSTIDEKTDGETLEEMPSTSQLPQTPIQRYLRKAELELENKKLNRRKLEALKEDNERKLSRVKSNTNEGNMCRTCHLRLGHTSRNCNYGKCLSVYTCGEEKLHPGESNSKQLRSSIQKLKNEIINLERNIAQKQEASDHVRQTL